MRQIGMKLDGLVNYFGTSQGRRISVVMLLLVWCAALIAARFHYTKSFVYLFLSWNLALAMVPLVASTLLVHIRTHRYLHGVLFIIWLLFFPNAPYLLTDLIHLAPKPPVPEWYDLALLLSSAGTGMFIGYLSLLDIHSWMEARTGRWWGWGVSVSVLFLSSFGIYLGRFLRWNSWDVFIAPKRLFNDMVVSFTNPSDLARTLSVTILFGVVLTLGYLAVQALADARKR